MWGLTNAAGPALAGVMIQNGSLEMPLVLGAVAYTAGGLAFGLGFRGVPAWPQRGSGSGSEGNATAP